MRFARSLLLLGAVGTLGPFRLAQSTCGPAIRRVKAWHPNPDGQVVEFPLNQISYFHEVPNPKRIGDPQHIPVPELMQIFALKGFDETHAVPLIHMPDGKYFTLGHHRVEAMRRLNETTIPAVIIEWETAPAAGRAALKHFFPDVFGKYPEPTAH